MKKIMWLVSIIPFVITGIALNFMPDTVPMHYDANGVIDRWGSKYENLLFPIIILALTLFWQLFIWGYEKKAAGAKTEKERKQALSNAKMLYIVAISMATMYCIMQCFILYGAYVEANIGASHSVVDVAKISCILLGGMFVVFGSFMPGTKTNGLVGFRTVWSMHNDVTWEKSNRFAGVAMIIVGGLTIITAIFLEAMLATGLMLVYLFISVTLATIYSYRVYKEQMNGVNK